MAKIDEMIRWMKATKTAPLDVLEKLKGMVGG
jgi:hypothetical protein